MSEGKHTPGPWTHEDGEIIASGVVIAQVMGADDMPCCEEDIDAECKANASLIASSPDLLKACLFVKAFFQKLEDNTDDNDPLVDG